MSRARLCSLDGCGEVVVGRKLCRNHYQQAWRRGEFNNAPLPAREVARTVCPPDHRHGEVRTCYVQHQCRCDACRDANRDHMRGYSKARAYGRYDTGLVPVGPVRAHMMVLAEFGLGYKRVAELAGLGVTPVRNIIWGRQEPGPRYGELQKRVKRETAVRILAVQPVVENLAGGALVPARGTVRRVQALIAFGYSQSQIAVRLGVNDANLSGLRIRYERASAVGRQSRVKVSARTARAAVEMYDEMSVVLPPRGGHRQKISFARATRMGAERGWPLPMDWEAYDNDFERPQPARRSVA